MSNPNDDRPPAYERPSYEPAPPVPNVDGGPLVRPKAIETAFQATLATIVIGAVSMVVTFLLDQVVLEDMAREVMATSGADPNFTEEQLVDVYRISIIIGVALYSGLNLLFAYKMRAGRNWARIVLTIFTTIGALSFLSAMASTGADLELIWSLAQVAFGVTAVIYMYRKESSEYFLAYKQHRMRR